MKHKKFTKYQQRAVNYHWQQITPSIFKFNAYVYARYHQVLNQVPRKKGIKILDIGCGDGVLLYLVSQKAKAKLHGVDLDADSLKFAKNQVKAKFKKSTAEKLPFKSNQFDLVIATEIIEHLKNPDKMLKEIQRVLKPKAKVIVTTPVKIFKTPEDPLHVKEFTQKELKSILKKYFKRLRMSCSHPYWLKKLYVSPWFKLGRFYIEPFRWLINAFSLLKLNPFYVKNPKPSQQMVAGFK